MYVSTHTFGAFYTYDRQRDFFSYIGQDVRKGIKFAITARYPDRVDVVGTTPILYSTKGSHGLWGAAGNSN